VEEEFCELRLIGFLRSSHKVLSAKFVFREFSEVAPGLVTPHTYLRCTTGRG
jgi:hypothetical protein